MSPLRSSPGVIRFGDFEADLRSGELCKHGIRLKLQVQPFQVLHVLLENAGQVVTREELQNRVWPSDTFVDFDHGLNNAVKKLREALGDNAGNPRFIETLSKRGYRFIGAVEQARNDALTPTPSIAAKPRSERLSTSRSVAWRTAFAVGAALAVATLIVGLSLGRPHGRAFHANAGDPSSSAPKGSPPISPSYSVPLIYYPLAPATVAPGSPTFTLTVNGCGFVPGSVVNWNGSGRATTFVSISELKVKIPASDIAKAGTASVTVVNPRPGGGASNETFFSFGGDGNVLRFVRTDFFGGFQQDSVAVGDFNNDGRLDVAVANAAAGDVGIMLGNGDGTFQSPVHYAAGRGPFSQLAVGDFNGDGELDLAVSNFGSDDISVLLGNGDGTFRAATNFRVGTAPTSVAVADLNGDGKLDLVVSNQNCSMQTGACPGTVSVLLGNGDGTFQAHRQFTAGQRPNWVAVGDFNRDGKVDLVVVGGDAGVGETPAASILLGNGDGTFQAPVKYPLNTNAVSVATADFNRDGKLDLAVVDNAGLVSVLLGNGDGTFRRRVDYPAGAFPWGRIGVGDFNGDGNLDLAVASFGSNSVTVLLGNGDGTFQAPGIRFAVGLTPQGVAVGDFNGNGRLDLAVPARTSNVVSILLQ